MVSDTLLINMYKGQLESKVMTTNHSKMKVIPNFVKLGPHALQEPVLRPTTNQWPIGHCDHCEVLSE